MLFFFFRCLTREKREGVKRFQSNLSAIHDELIPKSHYAIAINRRLASFAFFQLESVYYTLQVFILIGTRKVLILTRDRAEKVSKILLKHKT